MIKGQPHHMLRKGPGRVVMAACLSVVVFAASALAQPQRDPGLGFTDTPLLPGLKWHVHDPDRPHPQVVMPGETLDAPPSDAVVLFEGKDLSKWAQHERGPDREKVIDAQWPVRDGYFEVGPGAGALFTRESFGGYSTSYRMGLAGRGKWIKPGPGQ